MGSFVGPVQRCVHANIDCNLQLRFFSHPRSWSEEQGRFVSHLSKQEDGPNDWGGCRGCVVAILISMLLGCQKVGCLPVAALEGLLSFTGRCTWWSDGAYVKAGEVCQCWWSDGILQVLFGHRLNCIMPCPFFFLFLFTLFGSFRDLPAVGYHGRRNMPPPPPHTHRQTSPWCEPRAIKGSLFLSLN